MFEKIQGYRKNVLLVYILQNNENLLREIGFSEHDIIRLKLEFKKILTELFEGYLDFDEDQEKSLIERVLG